MQYWQVAAGSKGRDYSKYFLKYGMAFVGGKDNEATMNEIETGDVVLLKRGLYEVIATGRVVEREGKCKGNGDKEWLSDFDGWGLPAYCYVDWHTPTNNLVIFTDGLTRTTIQRMPQARHQEIANVLIENTNVNAFEPDPAEQHEVSDEQILGFLISEGLRPSQADDVTDTLRKIRLLANYYFHECDWDQIREHEARTFLLVPFFLALGWAEQQLKIEYPCSNGKIDIACIVRPHKSESKDCTLIVETKDFGSGLDYAPDQAHGYAKDFPSCRVIVVTNGYCYKSYVRREAGSDSFEHPFHMVSTIKLRTAFSQRSEGEAAQAP